MSLDSPVTKREFQRQRENRSFDEEIDSHRAMPASIEAEKGTLCSILLNPVECVPVCLERSIGSHCFYVPAYALVYSYVIGMHMNGRPVDIVTLTQAFHDTDKLNEIGGGGTISDLFSYLPTAMNFEYYLDTLIEKHTLREAIRFGNNIAVRAYNEQDDVSGLLDDLERSALAVRPRARSSPFATSKEAVMEAMELIGAHYANRGQITGLSTGLPRLDRCIDGLQNAEMIVLAARPSMGKTAMAMGIAEHIAVNLNLPIAIFSLEMSKRQLMQRMICSRARVNLTRVREGWLSDRDFPALTAAASTLMEAPFFFDDSSDLTIQELRSKARKLKKEHGIRAIFIDYLQLLRSTSKQAQDKREREVAEVSAGCKGMAKELDLPVVVLAQLSRDPEKRGPLSKPRLSDLRDSGSIEQDADTIGFITREEFYAETEEEMKQVEGLADLFIAKQRMGPRDTIPLTFLKEFTRFETRISDESLAAEADAAQGKLAY